MDATRSESPAQHAWQAGDDLDRLRGEAIFTHGSVAIIDIDPAGIVTAFNPAAERLFGLLIDDIVGHPVRVLMPDRTPEEVAALLADLASQPGVVPYDTVYRRPDGEVLDLSVTAVPLKRPIDGAAGITVVFRDFTELYRSQAAMATVAASETRYRTMVESAHEGIGVLDVGHRFIFSNPRMAHMLGYPMDEMIGLGMDAMTFPEDTPVITAIMARGLRGETEQTEVRLRRKDGSVQWAILATAPFPGDAGEIGGVAGFFTDITDRKHTEQTLQESETLLRSYFEYVSVGILLVKMDSVVVNVNPALCAITGYEADELVGTSLHALLGPEHAARIEENKVRFGALLGGETPSFEFERPFTTKAGQSIWLAVTVSVMRDEQGEPFELVAVVQDITSRKDAERVKDEFVSVTSHELRTPLTSIRGALGLLAGGVVGDLPDSAQRMLDIAVQSTDRLIRLVNDILDLERIASGTLALALQTCEAGGLVSRAIEEIRGAADASEVEVRAGSVDGRVRADPDRVIQTLTNLVGNATTGRPRSATVEVRATVDGGYVRFTVDDRGPGIPANQLETVFERFRQVDASDSRAKEGTGLGLAICRTIVEQHGGRIWAENVPGSGARFSFTLPVVADIGDEKGQEELADRASEPGVLVSDDDASIREVMRTMPESNGYRVWTTASGEEALAVAKARHPDVVVLDLILPGIDGRRTTTALHDQQETADTPVVVLSVLSAEQMAVEDAASRVGTPIEEDLLLTALRHALGGDHRQALVVEDDPHLAEVLEVTLTRHGLKVHHARTGRQAMQLGRTLVPDLLVLDLAISDGDGYSLVEWMREHHWLTTVPVLVYTAVDLEEADRDRLRPGDTKFLTKGRAPPALFEATLHELLGWITHGGNRK